MKLITIIMSSYNQSNYLRASLDSIINQTYSMWNLYIVNDCSTDNTFEILEEYSAKEERIKVFNNNKNLGLTYNLNFLGKLCNTEFIARMDSDDIAFKDRLKKQLNFLEKNPDISVVGSNAENIDTKGNKLFVSDLPLLDKNIKKQLLFKNVFYHSSVMMRKDFLQNLKYYNLNFNKCQDFELWLRGAKKYKYANLSDVLIKYRISRYNYKNDLIKIRILFQNLSLKKIIVLFSIFYTLIYMIYRIFFKFNR